MPSALDWLKGLTYNPHKIVPKEYWGKSLLNKIGEETGLKSTPSEAEKANQEQMRQYRDAMLAAAMDRMKNPLVAPQLGAPSWAKMGPPVLGPGTTLGGPPAGPPGATPAPPTPALGPPMGKPGTPFGAVPGVSQPGGNPMGDELERIRNKKILDAYTQALNPYSGAGHF